MNKKDLTIVQAAIREWVLVEEEENKRQTPSPNLWPSNLGKCMRRAFLRLDGKKYTIPHTPRLLNYFRSGVVMEDETAVALRHVYGERLREQFRLKKYPWSGRPDFLIDHNTENPILIEHKATGEKSWWEERIPFEAHVGQLVLYDVMYKHMFDVTPKLILYYRGWGHYAEFEIEPQDETILIHGMIDDHPVLKKMEQSIFDEMERFEQAYDAYQESGEMPDRLEKKRDGCTFMGKPDCPYYYHCWRE